MKVSIIITSYNQQQQTDLVLQSLSLQKEIHLSDVEIIIVDDGSIIPYLPLKNNLNLKVIRQLNAGRASARNTGIRAASNDFLIFVDGDRIIDEQFIHQYITQSKDGLNIGRVKEIYSRDISNYNVVREKIIKNQIKIPFYIFQTSVLYDNYGFTDSNIIWITTFSGNMGISKKLIEKAGLFNDSFKNWGFEHFELGYRLHKLNIPFYQIDATNYHLAHTRDISQLEKDIRDSIKCFISLHEDEILERFQSFLLGEISLQELETNKKAVWLTHHNENIFMGIGKRGVT